MADDIKTDDQSDKTKTVAGLSTPEPGPKSPSSTPETTERPAMDPDQAAIDAASWLLEDWDVEAERAGRADEAEDVASAREPGVSGDEFPSAAVAMTGPLPPSTSQGPALPSVAGALARDGEPPAGASSGDGGASGAGGSGGSDVIGVGGGDVGDAPDAWAGLHAGMLLEDAHWEEIAAADAVAPGPTQSIAACLRPMRDDPAFVELENAALLPDEPNARADEMTVFAPHIENFYDCKFPVYRNEKRRAKDSEILKYLVSEDYRQIERERIRATNTYDAPVYDLIDTVIKDGLLENQRAYIKLRDRWFLRTFFGAGLVLSLVLGAYLLARTNILGEAIMFGSIVGPIDFNVIAALVLFLLSLAIYQPYFLRRENLKRRSMAYRTAASNTMARLREQLANKINDIQRLQDDVGNDVQAIATPADIDAKRLNINARVLMWLPERVRLIEEYFRQAFDGFFAASAEAVMKRRFFQVGPNSVLVLLPRAPILFAVAMIPVLAIMGFLAAFLVARITSGGPAEATVMTVGRLALALSAVGMAFLAIRMMLVHSDFAFNQHTSTVNDVIVDEIREEGQSSNKVLHQYEAMKPGHSTLRIIEYFIARWKDDHSKIGPR